MPFREAKAAGLCRAKHWGEKNSLAREPRRLQRVPLKYSAEHSSGRKCDLLLGAGEIKLCEMLEGMVSNTQQAGNSALSHLTE